MASLVACRADLPTDPSAIGPRAPDLTLTGGTGTEVFPTVVPGDPQPVGVAIGLNASGQVTGSEFNLVTQDQDFKPYRWSAGAGAVKLVGCCDSESGNDINDAGTVVGVAQTDALNGNHAWVASGTTLTRLSALPGGDNGSNTAAIAINNSGQIVGVSPAPGVFGSHAVLWSSTGVIQDLGTLGGTNSSAIDINDAGQVIGSSQTTGNAATHFFLWSSGSGMQDLNTLIDPSVTSVVEINASGQIVGTYVTGGQSHAFLYTPGSGLRDLGTLGGTTSAPTGLNNNGAVVGSSTTSGGATHAFLWTSTDGMEDITAVTGVPEVRRLNDNLQTLTGTAAPSATPTFGRLRPKLIQLTVTPGSNTPPVARFTANCVGQSNPNQCAFDASASTDDAGIVSYKWDWGNGRSETKTIPTVRNTWASNGVYTVTLTVTDGNGATGVATQQITIGPVPNSAPQALITSPGYGSSFVQGTSINFVGSGDDAEDGTLPGSSLSWSSSIDGAIGTGNSFNRSDLSVGTHTITLTVTDSKGATGMHAIPVTITAPAPTNQPPVASFTWSCVGQVNPHQCAFDATGSTDDNGIVSYRWDWGNGRGETKTIATVRNTWAAAGAYTVTLTVTDTGGLTSSTSQQVVVP